MENSQKKFRVAANNEDDEPDDDRSDRDLAKRVRTLEKHFEHGGRVWSLENYKILLAGLGCACTLFGALFWYLVERFLNGIPGKLP